MKNKLFIFLTCVSFFLIRAQTPNFQWARNTGGPFGEYPTGLCTDANGNVYTAGSFSTTADFDPGVGTANLTSQGLTDVFISKLDANGNYLWAKRVGGLFADAVSSMKNDAAGNLYITGTFAGSVDFDPGTGSFILSTNSSTVVNTYVLKLHVYGNFLWALRVGDGIQNYPQCQAICIDNPGNIYVSGQFIGTRDFDPAAGVSNLVTTTLTAFLLKLDPLGNFVWARKLGGTDARSVVVDGSGNVYVGGIFSGTTDFDPGPGVSNLTCVGYIDGDVLKLDSGGNFMWVKQFASNVNAQMISLAFDCYGNLVGAGNFSATFDVDPGPGVSTFTSTSGNYDIFVVKLDPAGNFIWGDQIGGPAVEILNFMDTDGAGDVYLTGDYQGFGADFDPGPDTYSVNIALTNSLFIEKLSDAGNFVWAYAYGASNFSTIGEVIAIDSSFNVYVCGSFAGTIDFNPFAGVVNLTSAGLADNFILKFSQPGGIPPPASSNTQLCAGLNTQLIASGSGTLTWYASVTSSTGIGTGATFTTPVLTNSVTYYVENQVCGFTSTRTAVTVTVYPIPNVTIAASNTLICEGTVCTVTASGAQSYLWDNTTANPILTVMPTPTNSTYTVSGTSNSCTASASITFSVALCTGLESLSNNVENSFVIYPNPGNGSFHVFTPKEVVLNISNETGQMIRTISVKAGETFFALHEMRPGIYFVSVVNAAVRPQKIIISP